MYSKQYIKSPPSTQKRHLFWWWMLVDYFGVTINHIKLCLEIKRERQILTKLTDSQLLDIGVHRSNADAESQRSFFDLPADRPGVLAPDISNQD